MYRVSEIKNKNNGFTILVDNSEIHVFLNKRVELSSAYSSSSIQKGYSKYNSRMSSFKDEGMALYYNLKGDFSSQNIKK